MKILVLGGTGFVGKALVRRLAELNHTVSVLVHNRNPVARTKNINIIYGNILVPDTYDHALKESDVVINLVGIIREKVPEVTFHKMHVEAVEKLIETISLNNKPRYIHMSALGITSKSSSEYFRTKSKAEDLIKNSKLNWTILRPSIIWSKESDFVVQLETLNKFPIFVPLIGNGQALFQPILLEDLIEDFVKVIENKETVNQTLELGGPTKLTLKEMILGAGKNKKRFFLKLNVELIRHVAILLDKIGIPFPITPDQIRMIQEDNIIRNDNPLNKSHRDIFAKD